MLARFYLYLKDKIEIIEARLTSNFANHSSGLNPRIFFFQTIRLNLTLIILEILSDIIKFVIILFADSSHGFNVIFKQRELKTCPYSYHSYKAVQAKVKLFSFGGASAIVFVAVVTSLVTNLIFGGKQPMFAATYGWLQSNWSASSSDLASHNSDQQNWDKFESMDNNIFLANGGTDLQLLRTSGILGETNYADFINGTSNPASSTQIMGTDDEASVQISEILTSAKQIVAGGNHTCALKTDGSVYCWGYNNSMQLGDGSSLGRNLPLKVVGPGGNGFLSDVKQITASSDHTCAVMNNGSLYCWGKNALGQLGDNTTVAKSVPTQVRGENNVGNLQNVAEVAVGQNHTCARLATGAMYCWGYNGGGQLGDNTILQRNVPVPVHGASDVGYLSEVSQISAANNNTCAVKTDGTAFCWGGNVGDNTASARLVPTQVHGVDDVGYLEGVSQVSVGVGTSCALKSDGTVYCWGANNSGQLGDNTIIQKLTPVQVHGVNNSGMLGNIKQISSAGGNFICVLAVTDRVYCWGYNGSGQLGDNTITQRNTPIQVHGVGDVGNLSDVAQVSANGQYACALKADGAVYCWGANDQGQLGDGTITSRRLPVPVSGYVLNPATDFTQVAAGEYHTCGVKANGDVYCWGSNGSGALGDNTTISKAYPVRVRGVGNVGYLTGISQVAVGRLSTCAVKSDNTATYCWGYNGTVYGSGTLGDNTTVQRNTPVQVRGVNNVDFLTGVTQVSIGEAHTCAVTTDYAVYCWGANDYGQLGDNTIVQKLTPVQVHGPDDSGFLLDVDQVQVGYRSSCARMRDGSAMYCWGSNHNGRLGDNTTIHRYTPVQVHGVNNVGFLAEVSQVAVGKEHTCALNSTGDAFCWGRNIYGEIGDNSISDRYVPVQVHGANNIGLFSGVAKISAGAYRTCIKKTDNSMFCWGDNSYGQFGDNTTTGMRTPVQVHDIGNIDNSLDDVSDISTAAMHTCAVKIDGTAYCWGSNGYGQLGTVYGTNKLAPAAITDHTASGSLLLSVKQSSGTYLSSIIDLVYKADLGSLAYTNMVPSGTTFSIDIKAGNTDTPDESWLEINDVANGQDLSALDGKRYVQYRLNMTADVSNTLTPSLQDISINYNYYQGGSLTSSPYNSTDIANLMGGFSWTEILATSTGVTLYLRSASTSAELASASWEAVASSTDAGLSSPDCAKDGGTGEVSCSLDAVPAALRDGAGDQWFQYRIALSSDGVYTPTFNDINLTYVVNATPEVAIINIPVTQSSADGKIAVDYQVRDTDTNTGRTPGYVNLTLEYCTANCTATGSESWSVASEAALTGEFGASTTVDLVSTSTWTNHSLVWDPNIDFEGQYIPAEFKLRLVANDSEGANNLGRSESNPLLLDTADPLIGPSGVLAKVDATANPALVTLNATDDTTLYMKVGLNPDLSDAPVWLPYASTTTINLTTDPDTVYVQFKDEYNNLTDISPVTPETPINMVIRDLTNSDVGSFMEFIAWKVVTTPGPGFKQYNIWRGEGTDTVPPESYSLLATIGSSSKNYHLDTTVVAGTTYYYKISSEDSNGNQSYFSQVVKDAPDGQGGTDNTPPTIKGVEVVTTSTQSATIEWDTDELSDSLVGYSLTESDFSDMLGIDTMSNYSTSTATSHGYDPQAANGRHRVTLSGLTPGTTYYFKVKSTDPQGNYAEDTNGGAGFSFATKPGPRMQFGPIVTSINNQRAVINWQTDILANATVVYATGTDFLNAETASTTEFLIDQQVTVAGLQPNTKYYFYIKNQDEQGNESIIKKVENGIESYYDFTTTNDANPPVIEEVTCSILSDTSLSIKWKTTAAGSGKPATARVDYGSQSGSYASSTETAMEYNADHTVELSDLLASSTYYFQVVSTDLNGNTATSSEYSCGTSEELVTKTEADKLIQEAKATGKSEGLASAPGGGIMTIDKTDKTAPIISDIRISNLTATSARVSWVTNEEGNSILKFGVDSNYGKSAGDDRLSLDHNLFIENLLPNTQYNYTVSSADASGNLAKSDNLTFQTPALSAEEALALSTSTVPGTKEDRETLMKSIAEKAISIITSMANQVSLGSLENTLLSQYNAIEKLAQIIPAPVLSGEPSIDTTPTTATIRWNTDKPSNSLIAFVPEAVYAGARGDAAYSQVVGDALAQVTKHEVKLYNLKPEVVYHYQLRSKAPLGPLAASRDFSFKTKPEALEITSYTVDTLSPQKTTFRWLTSSQTDTQLRITPFRGNMLAVEEAKAYIDKTPTTNHEQLIDQLESGTVYQVTLFGIDQKGIRVEKVIPTFSTTKDDLPPTIDNIQTESALSQGKDLKVQTAISWTTNEPTACSLKYAKGSTQVETDLTEETIPEASYSRKHALVITKFELGSVYSFRIYCTDSGDNQTISEPHAILTPKQRDSVFDLIINTMEQTFGWIGKLKG